ncbi:MAG: fumarylacetoacetate hydrolase family protein [Desulfobacterales bacterium]|nr:fumarylacetoacetate hydrolase family protein [Desulfobacterales bacterium]
MKIVRFIDSEGTVRLGADPEGDRANEVIETGDGGYAPTGAQPRIERFLAPVAPYAVFCIGLNYRRHAAETGLDLPAYPVLFMKNPASVIGHGENIVLPESCRQNPQVDYEAELAVVIGRAARNISEENALEYVKGYTAGNDVSARWWQKNAGGGQWIRGKSFDTFCPLGPVMVTADEIPDPDSLDIACMVNNGIMQQSNTSDMIFSVSRLIAYLSEDTTLLPDTVIMTGTPEGVGFVRDPAVYLEPRDRVTVEIEKIGLLENPVV